MLVVPYHTNNFSLTYVWYGTTTIQPPDMNSGMVVTSEDGALRVGTVDTLLVALFTLCYITLIG